MILKHGSAITVSKSGMQAKLIKVLFSKFPSAYDDCYPLKNSHQTYHQNVVYIIFFYISNDLHASLYCEDLLVSQRVAAQHFEVHECYINFIVHSSLSYS